jgi:DNA-directed RNA polymerase, mitochondrial
MEIAKSYLDETFYLPHNVDFRGRAYPIPPYLNQMGADNCRGLLLFDKGRELGEEGLRWLKIHLSNVFGYDKASLSDRAQFPMDHLDDIYDSVRKPLDGKKWWLTAEDPWQCLATCFELTRALESPDPTKFVSRLPVHQDGSCNGLQHYAALGGDIAGARQVNLEPGDKPADVYSGVCELVKAEITEEATKGNALAKLLDGKVTRKVVKQTVMTNVYGVTFLGAIRQVRKQVEDLIPEVSAAGVAGTASTYIARKIFKGLGTLFTGAHDIQYWLGDCANRISSSISPAQLEKIYNEVYNTSKKAPKLRAQRKKEKANKDNLESAIFRSPVIWTTPLKLPVVQPYRVNKGQQIHTNLQSISLSQPSVADSVHKRKQLQAFPPNFIHSLDATHMILSALKANEMGLSFAAVHDSFWTHAADVNKLNELLRDAFIRMHSDDIIGRLAAEFNKRYDGHYYLAHVHKTSPLGQAILDHRKDMTKEGIFPTVTADGQLLRQLDLAREIRRQKLLQSKDERERLEGEAMVTASTLFAQMDGEKQIFSKDSLGETAMGMIPETASLPSPDVLNTALSSPEVVDDVDLTKTLDPLRDNFDNDDPDSTTPHLSSQPSSQQQSAYPFPPTPTTSVDVFGRAVRTRNNKKLTKTAKEHADRVWVWLPMRFREVPKKGDFDVRRLRESTYFFS